MSTRDRVEASAEGHGSATVRRFRRTVALGAASAAVIAVAGLIGYATGMLALGSIRPHYVPMAPSSAICFLILSAVLYGQDRDRWTGAGRPIAAALVFLVAFFGLLEIIGDVAGLDLTGEHRLASGLGMLGDIPLGRMSPVTAFAFVMAGLGTLLCCLRAWNVRRVSSLGHAAASLGLVTTLVGATVLLGYVFGTPVMYGGGTVPMAATTAVALLFLGTAVAAVAGPTSFPNRLVVGDSLAAVLLRDLLFLTASALLTQGVLAQWVSHLTNGNDALEISALIIVTCAITAAVVARVSHRFVARLEESTRELRDSQELHRTILQAATDGVWLVDTEGRILEVNDSYTRMSGYSAPELLTMRISDLEAIESNDDVAARTRDILARGKGRFEAQHRRKDGSVFEVAVSVQYHAADGGRFAAFLEDITERRRAEAVLRQQESQVRRVLESVALIGLILDRQGNITFCNDYFLSLTGWSRADVMGRNWFENFLPPDVRETMRNEVFDEAVHRGKAIAQVENEIMTRTGERRIIRWSNSLLRNVTGSVDSVASIGEDVSARRRAEDALKESEYFFRESQRAANIGSYRIDFTTGVWMSSEVLDAIFGIDASHPRSMSGWVDLIHPDDSVMMTQYLQDEVRGQGHPFDKEYRIVRKNDGAVRWVRGIGALLFAADSTVTGMTGTIQDVTERKEAEERLRQSEEKFRNLFNNAQVAMFRTRLDGSEMLDLNDPYLRILGRTREEVVGHPSAIVWANPRERAEMMQRLEADGFVTDLEFDLVNRDDEVRRCVTSLRLYRDEGILEGSLQDITDRRRAEDSLRQSELRLRDITSSIGDWVWEVDEHGVYTYSSAKGTELFGDVIGKTSFDFMPPEEAARVAAIFAGIAAAKAPIRDLENWNVTKDGDPICLLTNGFPIRGEDGQLTGYRGVDRDITDRRRAEQEQARLAAQLLQAQKMESVGRLAGGVAHDFNNMLGVILGNAELAMDQLKPADPIQAELEEIRNAATRSAGLTRQLLAFARKQTIAPTVLNLNDTVSGMLRMLQRLIGEDIDLRWIPAPDLWSVKIDPSQIDQILANLCVNARDAITGTGELTIETSHRSFTTSDCVNHPEYLPGEYVTLGVSDNGVGMNAETFSHLFEPFFTTKEVGKGTGLGLATVYGIVRQNGGFIDVASEPSHGTSFRIYLPRHVGRSELAPLKGTSAAVRHSHETILLVEDEPGILSLAARMLERQGYTVLRAATPGEAIRLAQEHAGEIHLLLTDVVMPEMNGHDLARNVLSLYPHIRRLFMSGYTADVIAHHGVLEAGVHFIHKPFTQDGLIRKVREAMDGAVGG